MDSSFVMAMRNCRVNLKSIFEIAPERVTLVVNNNQDFVFWKKLSMPVVFCCQCIWLVWVSRAAYNMRWWGGSMNDVEWFWLIEGVGTKEDSSWSRCRWSSRISNWLILYSKPGGRLNSRWMVKLKVSVSRCKLMAKKSAFNGMLTCSSDSPTLKLHQGEGSQSIWPNQSRWKLGGNKCLPFPFERRSVDLLNEKGRRIRMLFVS